MKFKISIKNKLKKNWHYFIIFFLAIIFFIGTSSFNFFTQSYGNTDFVKWASPDETGNYTFSKLYAQKKTILIPEEYNIIAGDIIKPRSFRSDDAVLKPVSFLGIILIYGKIASLFSYKIIPYLTPFFAAIGLFYYYALVKKIFGKNNALLSVSLLAFFPPYVYYSARSMFHNVLFTVLLVIGLYYLFLMNGKRKKRIPKKGERLWWWRTSARWRAMAYSSLAGLFFGLAISVRTSELLWLAPVLGILWIFNIRKTGVLKIILFCSFAVLALFPNFYYNQQLYGSFYLGGYAEMNKSIIEIKDASANIVKAPLDDSVFNKEFFNKLKDNILVFGLDIRQSEKILYYYLINMFPWLFWSALFGFIIFIFNWRKSKYRQWVYFLCLALVSIILILYYGSWQLYDNPNKASHTIGNSYTRYWLPIYLGLIPLVSLLFIKITRFICKIANKMFAKIDNRAKFFSWRIDCMYPKWGMRIIAVGIISYLSINFALAGSEEGLIYLKNRQMESKKEWQEILKITEQDSLIITRFHDKVFFPERRVIVGLFNDDNMNKEYANLVNHFPVYYYNFTFPEKDFNYLNSSKLKAAGLSIERIKRITPDFTLYRLKKIEAPESSESRVK